MYTTWNLGNHNNRLIAFILMVYLNLNLNLNPKLQTTHLASSKRWVRALRGLHPEKRRYSEDPKERQPKPEDQMSKATRGETLSAANENVFSQNA